MKKNFVAIAAIGAACLLSSCGTIVTGTTQNMRVDTQTREGAIVEQSRCVAQVKGTRYVFNSGSKVVIPKSKSDMPIVCEKPGYPVGKGTAISRYQVLPLLGNIILFGGPIGIAIDYMTDASFKYPEWIGIVMGEHRIYDEANSKRDTINLGTMSR